MSLRQSSYRIYMASFFVTTLGINLLILLTYLLLNRNFRQQLVYSKEMRILKKGALVITSLTAASYFMGYVPLAVLYFYLCWAPGFARDLSHPWALILDFVLRLLPHMTSCLLPLFLVSNKSIQRLQPVAFLAKNSFRGVMQSFRRTVHISLKLVFVIFRKLVNYYPCIPPATFLKELYDYEVHI